MLHTPKVPCTMKVQSLKTVFCKSLSFSAFADGKGKKITRKTESQTFNVSFRCLFVLLDSLFVARIKFVREI